QAEDGIRDFHVTGVQTCALPIFTPFLWMLSSSFKVEADVLKFPIEWIPSTWNAAENYNEVWFGTKSFVLNYWNSIKVAVLTTIRSEERRVGKEWRSRWSADH